MMDFGDLMRGGTAPVKSKPSNMASTMYNTTRPKTRAVENDFQDTNIDLRTNRIKNNNTSTDYGNIINNNEFDFNRLNLQENFDKHSADTRRSSSRGRPSKDVKKSQNGLSAYTQNMPNIVLNSTRKVSSKLSTNNPSSPRTRGNISQLNDLRAAYGADIPMGKTKASKTNNNNENSQENEEREYKTSSRISSAVKKKDIAEVDSKNKGNIRPGSTNYSSDGTASPSSTVSNTKKVRKSTGLTGLLKASLTNKQASDPPISSSSNRASPVVMLCTDLQSTSFDSSESNHVKEMDRNISSPVQFSLQVEREGAEGREGFNAAEPEEQSSNNSSGHGGGIGIGMKSFDESDENHLRNNRLSITSVMEERSDNNKTQHHSLIVATTGQTIHNEIFPAGIYEEETLQHHIPIIQQAIAIGSEATLLTIDKAENHKNNNNNTGKMRIDTDESIIATDEDERPQTRKLYLGSNNNNNGNQSTGRAPKSAGARFSESSASNSPTKTTVNNNYDFSQNSMFAPVSSPSYSTATATSPKGASSSRRIQLKKLASNPDLHPATSTFWNATSSNTTTTATAAATNGGVNSAEDTATISSSSNGNGNGNAGKYLSPVMMHRPPSRQKTAFPTHLADINAKTTSTNSANAVNSNMKKEDMNGSGGSYKQIEEDFDLNTSHHSNTTNTNTNTNTNGMYLNREHITLPPNSGGSGSGSGSTVTTTATNNSSSIDPPETSSHNYYENRPPSRQKIAAQHLFDGNTNANTNNTMNSGSTIGSIPLDHSLLRRTNSQSRISSTATANNTTSNSSVRGNNNNMQYHSFDSKEDGFFDIDNNNNNNMTIPVTINNSSLDDNNTNTMRRSSHRNNPTTPATATDITSHNNNNNTLHIRPKSVTTIPHHTTPIIPTIPMPPTTTATASSAAAHHRYDDSSIRSKSANSHVPSSRTTRYIDPNNPMISNHNASTPSLLLPPSTANSSTSSTRPNIRPMQGAWSSSTSTTAVTINAAANVNNNNNNNNTINHDIDPRVIPRAQNAFGLEYDSGWTSPSLVSNPYALSPSPENYPLHSVHVRDYHNNNILLDDDGEEDDEMTILTEDSDQEEDFHPMDHSLSLQSVQLETSLDEDFLKLFAPAGR